MIRDPREGPVGFPFDTRNGLNSVEKILLEWIHLVPCETRDPAAIMHVRSQHGRNN